jgi:hypothetical protein
MNQICPHLYWRWMFIIFGILGFIWVGAWILSFKDLRIISNDDDYIIAPSVRLDILPQFISKVIFFKINRY